MLKKLIQVVRNEKGQSLIEYVLILALVAVVLIGALKLLQGGLNSVFSNVTNALTNP